MYAPKSYVNHINNTIVKNNKSGIMQRFYYVGNTEHIVFVMFPHKTHFIYYADLTPEAETIVSKSIRDMPTGKNVITSLANVDIYDRSIGQLILSKEYEPIEKSSIKSLLCFTSENGKAHYLNKALLTKYGKLHNLVLFSSPCSRLSTVFVFRDNGIGQEAEYLGAIVPINPKLENFREVQS